MKRAPLTQKWMLEWLKMSVCRFMLWKHWGDSTIATSSPPSSSGTVFKKKSFFAICMPKYC